MQKQNAVQAVSILKAFKYGKGGTFAAAEVLWDKRKYW